MTKKTRTKSIEIRLTDEELDALHLAKGDKGTLARYAREKLLADTTHTERVATVATYTELVFQLKKVGTNINQIAHQLNKGEASKVGVLLELRQVLAELRALADTSVKEVL